MSAETPTQARHFYWVALNFLPLSTTVSGIRHVFNQVAAFPAVSWLHGLGSSAGTACPKYWGGPEDLQEALNQCRYWTALLGTKHGSGTSHYASTGTITAVLG